MSGLLLIPCGPDYFQEMVTDCALNAVEARFGVDRAALRGCSKSPKFAFPRQVSLVVLSSLGVSGARAGDAVGRGDTAINYANQKHAENSPHGARLRREAEAVRRSAMAAFLATTGERP